MALLDPFGLEKRRFVLFSIKHPDNESESLVMDRELEAFFFDPSSILLGPTPSFARHNQE